MIKTYDCMNDMIMDEYYINNNWNVIIITTMPEIHSIMTYMIIIMVRFKFVQQAT